MRMRIPSIFIYAGPLRFPDLSCMGGVRTHTGRVWEPNYLGKAKIMHSLVPRLFPPPVFDRVLYAKTKGDSLVPRPRPLTRRKGSGDLQPIPRASLS